MVLPYLDGIESYNLIPFSPEARCGDPGKSCGLWRAVSYPVSERKAKSMPGMSTAKYNQSVIPGPHG